MKTAFTGAIILALSFSSATPCRSGNDTPDEKIISEDDVQIISARMYAAILITACNNGWRYPLDHVKNGFRRHFKEMKLQLLNDGYSIVSVRRASDGGKSPRAKAMPAGRPKSPWIACASPYWGEIRGGIPHQ